MEQLYFYFDQSRCIGCNTCVVACTDWNDIKPGTEKYRKLVTSEMGSFVQKNVRVAHLVYTCWHCANPACLSSCPAEAIFKRESDGLVLVDHEKCVGAGECVLACPYGAIHMENRGLGEMAYKCTFCGDRLVEGKRPSCVVSCPQRALDSGTKSALEARHPNLIFGAKAVAGFPGGTTGNDGRKVPATGPSVAFKLK